MQLHASHIQNTAGNLLAYDAWIRSLNRTRATGHRWRKVFPWLKTVNILGKNYITRETIAEFERRALAGEFQKNIHPVPPATAKGARQTRPSSTQGESLSPSSPRKARSSRR